MPRFTTISIRSAISSPAKITNKGELADWPSGAPSRPNHRLDLRLLRPTQTTCRCSDRACLDVCRVDHRDPKGDDDPRRGRTTRPLRVLTVERG